MPGRQAKIITSAMLRRMLRVVAGRQTTRRDRVIILLSAKAGLRACEIARLDWSMVLDARGRVADTLAVSDAIAKKRGGRRIPMHACLIPTLADQNPCAQSRNPRDMMRHGCSTSLFHASQQ